MDLILGLGAANQAIGIVKELRDLGRSVDEATFKLKLADLTSALADAKIALADAKETVAALEAEVDNARNGEICPKCLTGRLRLSQVEPHHQMGMSHFGAELWKYECSAEECDFKLRKIHDPHGAIPKLAAKK